jgi:hypothetical protein
MGFLRIAVYPDRSGRRRIPSQLMGPVLFTRLPVKRYPAVLIEPTDTIPVLPVYIVVIIPRVMGYIILMVEPGLVYLEVERDDKPGVQIKPGIDNRQTRRE